MKFHENTQEKTMERKEKQREPTRGQREATGKPIEWHTTPWK